MTNPTILVTGATGKTGAGVVHELRKADWPVRAMVSREDARSDALRAIGAEVVVADMYDPEQVYLALKGTQRAYYVPPMQPYMIQAANAFMVAAREARIESVVQMSQWTSSASHPTAMTRQTWLIDRAFAMIPGVAHTIFNPGMFADNFLRVIDFAALLGIYPVLMGDSACAPISNEDMARCVATLLMTDPALHAGRSFHPTGTELLTGQDMARIIARVVGHGVRAVALPFWIFRKVARMQRIDAYQIALLIQYAEDSRQGAFSYMGGVTRVMDDLTGQPAESFERTAQRYAVLPFAQQTFANRTKAIANFMLAPLVPGYNTDALERAWRIPSAIRPKYCMQDERWLTQRSEQMAEQSAPPAPSRSRLLARGATRTIEAN